MSIVKNFGIIKEEKYNFCRNLFHWENCNRKEDYVL